MLSITTESETGGAAGSKAATSQVPSPGNTRFVEELFGIRFTESSTIRRAITDFTHNRRFEKQYKPLDFLGDATLTLALRQICYSGAGLFEAANREPLVEQLSRNSSLWAAGRRSGLDKVILYEKNGVVLRDASRIQNILVANIVESVLGAVFLNGGLDDASRAVRILFNHELMAIGAVESSVNPLDTACMPGRKPAGLARIEGMLGHTFQDGEIFSRLKALGPEDRSRVFNRLIRLGAAAMSVVTREHTVDETSRLHKFPVDGRFQSGNPYGIHPPKKVRAFPRRLGPVVSEFFKECFPDCAPASARRAACAIVGILVRDGGYRAAKQALLRATAGG